MINAYIVVFCLYLLYLDKCFTHISIPFFLFCIKILYPGVNSSTLCILIYICSFSQLLYSDQCFHAASVTWSVGIPIQLLYPDQGFLCSYSNLTSVSIQLLYPDQGFLCIYSNLTSVSIQLQYPDQWFFMQLL